MSDDEDKPIPYKAVTRENREEGMKWLMDFVPFQQPEVLEALHDPPDPGQPRKIVAILDIIETRDVLDGFGREDLERVIARLSATADRLENNEALTEQDHDNVCRALEALRIWADEWDAEEG